MSTKEATILSLDPLQRAAAQAPPGPMMILGGPGTGKSRSIMARIAALVESRIPAHTIVCLTHSSRGACDIRQQLAEFPQIAHAAPQALIATPQQWAHYVLRNGGAEVLGLPPQFSLWDHRQAEEFLATLSKSRPGQPAFSAGDINEILRRHRVDGAMKPGSDNLPDHPWKEIISRYRQEKLQQGVLDMGDLVPMALEAVQRDQALRETLQETRSRHVLVDDFHTCSPSQYQLLMATAGVQRSITVAADPNQSIKRDLGAEPSPLRRFRMDHPEAAVHELRLSHRHTRRLAETTAALASSRELPGLSGTFLGSFRPVGHAPEIIEVTQDPTDVAARIGEAVQSLLEQGYSPGDMACICRDHADIDRLKPGLDRLNIPTRTLADAGPHLNASDRRTTGALAWVLNPRNLKGFYDSAFADAERESEMMLLQATTRIFRMAREMGIDPAQAAEQQARQYKPGSLVHQALRGIIKVRRTLESALEEPDVSPMDLWQRAEELLCADQEGGPHTRVGLDVAEALSRSESVLGADRETPRRWLARFLDLLNPDLHPCDPPDRRGGMALATINEARGMQWKAVILVGAISDERAADDAGPISEDMVQEEDRILYVGLTRASDRVYWLEPGGIEARFVRALRAVLEGGADTHLEHQVGAPEVENTGTGLPGEDHMSGELQPARPAAKNPGTGMGSYDPRKSREGSAARGRRDGPAGPRSVVRPPAPAPAGRSDPGPGSAAQRARPSEVRRQGKRKEGESAREDSKDKRRGATRADPVNVLMVGVFIGAVVGLLLCHGLPVLHKKLELMGLIG